MHIGKALIFDMPEEMVIEAMEKYGIDYALVSNVDSTEVDFEQKEIPKNLQFTQVESLERVLKFARNYPEKIGVLVWVKPYGEKISEEFVKMIEDNRDIIYGMKVHQYHSKTPLNDPKMKPYIELAKKFHFPVVAHTAGDEISSPVNVWKVAKENPEIDFVMVHMGLGTDNEEAIHLLADLPNLYGDTTWVPVKSTIKAIETAGADKIMFGSDSPIDGVDTYHHNPKGEVSLYQDYFCNFKSLVGEETYEKVMSENAKRVFGLK